MWLVFVSRNFNDFLGEFSGVIHYCICDSFRLLVYQQSTLGVQAYIEQVSV